MSAVTSASAKPAVRLLALSPDVLDAPLSRHAAEAGRHRVLLGSAEDILAPDPDRVVAGRFTRRAIRELLRAKGLRLAGFDAPPR